MDIFVQNLPPQATQREVKNILRAPLAGCGIQDYHIEKRRNKTHGKISVLDVQRGQQFLSIHGAIRTYASRPIIWCGKTLSFKEDRYAPDPLAISALAYESVQRTAAASGAAPASAQNAALTRFEIKETQCGMWDYAGTQLAFVPYYTDRRHGSVTFGTTEAVILLGDVSATQYRLQFRYADVESIILGSYQRPTVSIKLRVAPKLYQTSLEPDDGLAISMSRMNLGPQPTNVNGQKKIRITSLNESHKAVAGICFVYQIFLRDYTKISTVRTLLGNNPRISSVTTLHTSVLHPPEPLLRSFIRLDHDLTDQSRYGSLPFSLLYQVSALAKNGILHPLKVRELLPKIWTMHGTRGLDITLSVMRAFKHQVPSAEPELESKHLSTVALHQLLEDLANASERYEYSPEDPYQLTKRHQHIKLVHKIVVTPTGVLLFGPHPEPTNRVLRRYADKSDHFVRVVFQDEDGSSVRYDPRSNQDNIYHVRFKQVLDDQIVIAGRAFSFLGFSHSSLRSQSCWFMAPIFVNGGLRIPTQILKDLGDFSNIRVPAKCAARIGQNFTDTNATVILDDKEVTEVPMIQRNGYDFSDGVGTISQELLEAVWRVYGTRRLLKPTALQVRYQGCKGMVSLDSRLSGKRLLLRANMKKFDAPAARHLEICGAGFRPLPMILNRQLIKILEDLGVAPHVFVNLQTNAVQALRIMTGNAINTAHFLEQADSTRATNVSSLIYKLGLIGLDYHTDSFLYGVVEMAIITKLRDIKYRGRIAVEKGVTLYGIMDETGYLRANEIYVVTESSPQGGRWELINDKVIITRSPVMHPGDVQIVNAVNVPADSPLKELRNVVVFSQHGTRDLPSMLSGGDLDGDLYNVIWDKELVPKTAYQPAEYPRVAAEPLDREVTRKDMSDFFVNFMQTDQLGMLSNIHLQLADQRLNGTFDPDCIRLAQMASTAVDFSKTGVAVDMSNCPRYPRLRPDYMAPSPRIFMAEEGQINFEDEVRDDAALEDLDIETSPMRFYRSKKVLGELYRAIDEQQFLRQMQQQRDALVKQSTDVSLLENLLKYVKREAAQYGVLYDHHTDLAVEIRAGYEDSLLDVLYQFGPASKQPASEHEAFAGSILGRQGGAQGKPLRDLSKAMREQFEAVCEYTVLRVVRGDEQMAAVGGELDALYDDEGGGLGLDREVEALPRAIACLEVAVGREGRGDRVLGELRSFRYLVAGVCLRELERFRVTTLGSYGLPRV